jgi:mono/diheme cytochrome c family protein
MRLSLLVWSLALAGFLGLGTAAALQAAPNGKPVPVDPQAADFFEREVRPLLLAECAGCHGAAVQQGGLRLDSREALLKGGARGPSIAPGHPERSLLLKAVRHDGLKMPPGKRLPDAKIAALESWVRAGAPWPESSKQKAEGRKQPASEHWAFRRVTRPAVPAVKNRKWVRTPVDAFILSRLERAGLSPSPEADPGTLIRRVYFDLIGLPPTAEEVEAFVNEYRAEAAPRGAGEDARAPRAQRPTPNAYDRLVDRLLADPRYGERWGRHWLDVARYADTKDGVLMYGEARVRPYAYTYRDYVIRALNEDTPYDRFVHEQLAADQLGLKESERWRLAAMGFLTLGRQFDNNIHDVIDDRIDTVTRGLLGLTVACARCHDHKYDPVPTADYYSLYGVFAASEMPVELPLIAEPERTPAYLEWEKQYVEKKQKLQDHFEKQYAVLSQASRERAADYLVHVATTEPDPLETAIFFLSLAPEDLRPQIVNRWRLLIEKRARPEDPVFGAWKELMAAASQTPAPPATCNPQPLRAVWPATRNPCAEVAAAWSTRPKGTGSGQANPLVVEALSGAKLADRASVARAYGELLRRVYDESRQPNAPPLTPERKQLLELVEGPESPGYFAKRDTWAYMSRGEKDAFGGMRNELDVIAVKSPAAPPRAMVLVDSPEIHEPRIFIRGSAAQPGERVPRRFLRLVAGENPRAFTHGSGRLELAKAITDPANPLTARVIVNRVWMHHFGEPLAPTPSDFGLRSAPPTHAELLDWLASWFASPTGAAYSLKKLHRLMVTSSTYLQSSAVPVQHLNTRTPEHPNTPVRNAQRLTPTAQRLDPENRLLWRMNRRRLDFEQMRDSLLAVSGRLDPAIGGRPVPDATDPGSRRRTVYCLVDRQSLPEAFRSFNFPQPDQSVERRPDTTVPQQALFGLNSPFVLEQARALAARPQVAGQAQPEARVEALYRLLFARKPGRDELAAGLDFIRREEAAPASKFGPWEQYAQVLLLTNEFMFLD